VTLRVRDDVPNLRAKSRYRSIRQAFVLAKERFGFRLLQYSVQRTHLHLIAEAHDRRALSRGMQGLAIRVARRINRVETRRGSVFRDRYHARQLKTPREVRAALVYVLNNARRHREWGGAVPRDLTDYEYSSAPYFTGWAIHIPWQCATREARPPPVTSAKSWLLTRGWLRATTAGGKAARGRIRPAETPGRNARPKRVDDRR
jgi:REP element-mobilizing transposase RayT